MAVEVVTLAELYQTEIRVGTHIVLTDAPASFGGKNKGPSPHNVFHGSIGACTAITLAEKAKRKGYDLKRITIKVTKSLVDDPEASGQKIPLLRQSIELVGNLTEEQVADLTATVSKCPVHREYAARKLTEHVVTHKAPPAVSSS